MKRRLRQSGYELFSLGLWVLLHFGLGWGAWVAFGVAVGGMFVGAAAAGVYRGFRAAIGGQPPSGLTG